MRTMVKRRSGSRVLTRIEHSIDCDADPYVPTGWSVRAHRRRGVVLWDAGTVALFHSGRQVGGMCITGFELLKELSTNQAMNANVLDFLLAHPRYIPTSWKGKYVYFMDTIYDDDEGDGCVRCLVFSGVHWYWSHGYLRDKFSANNPAAVRVA